MELTRGKYICTRNADWSHRRSKNRTQRKERIYTEYEDAREHSWEIHITDHREFFKKIKISPCFPPESPYHLPNINFLSNAEYSLEDTRYIVSKQKEVSLIEVNLTSMSYFGGGGGWFDFRRKYKNLSLLCSGFTLVEIMIVIAMIGILAAALFPNMTGYLKRARDAARASDLNNIATGIAMYEIDKETLPPHVSGCYPTQKLLSGGYIKVGFISPKGAGYDEGCGVSGKYAYGVSTGNVLDPQSSLLMAVMENQNGGNYTGSTSGMTGDLTLLGHFNATFGLSRWTGSIYILRPSAGSGGTAGNPPPAGVNGSCSWVPWLCSLGTVDSDNPWVCWGSRTWICKGQFGGSNTSCISANAACPPVNGACGSANNVDTLAAPSSGLCNAGTPTSVITSPWNYSWNCNGQNGWTNTGCTAPRYYTVASCTARWQTYTGGSTYSTCNSTDKIVCTGVGVGNTWSMCNVGSTVAGTTSASYGYMFQWGRNVPFPSTGTCSDRCMTTQIWLRANATGSFITELIR
jgi:prepilin-type N-terminal cleavage/methylation domain-containing protein